MNSDELQKLLDTVKTPTNIVAKSNGDDRRDLLIKFINIQNNQTDPKGLIYNQGVTALAVYDAFKADFDKAHQARQQHLEKLEKDLAEFKKIASSNNATPADTAQYELKRKALILEQAVAKKMDNIEHEMMRNLTSPTYFSEDAKGKVDNIRNTVTAQKTVIYAAHDKAKAELVASLHKASTSPAQHTAPKVSTQQIQKTAAVAATAKSEAKPESKASAKNTPAPAETPPVEVKSSLPTPKPNRTAKQKTKAEEKEEQQQVAEQKKHKAKSLLGRVGYNAGYVATDLLETTIKALFISGLDFTKALFNQIGNLFKSAEKQQATDAALNQQKNDDQAAVLTAEEAAEQSAEADNTTPSNNTPSPSLAVKTGALIGETLGEITRCAINGFIGVAIESAKGVCNIVKAGFEHVKANKSAPAEKSALTACAAKGVQIESPASNQPPLKHRL